MELETRHAPPRPEPRTAESDAADLYGQYARPRVARLLKLLKLDLSYTRAEGDRLEYVDEEGRTRSVVDALGGYGSTILGHNPPELVSTLRRTLDGQVPVHAQASVREGAALVGRELNRLMEKHGGDGRRFVVTLCNSGAEAVEAGLKHALMEWQERRARLVEQLELRRTEPGADLAAIDRYVGALEALEPLVVAIDGSFHGKTAGSVSVTTNLEFKQMYARGPVRSAFLSREEDWSGVAARLEPLRLASPVAGFSGFSPVAAVLFEAIQGEGGIQPLTPEFAAVLARAAREHQAPLVADEIQCGLFRTGTFLAAHAIGLRPDYVLLGKGLGGGLAKVSALLVAEERYQEKFGFVHTSTFAEDEPSSRVALRALEILDEEAPRIAERAAWFEGRLRERAAAIGREYPGVLSEVRGRGFLLGIELNFDGEDSPVSTLLHTIHQAGFATYVYASYLLHRHGVRVGVTLSKPDTLRIEPSAFLRDESAETILDALEDLCATIHARKLLRVTRHFWSHPLTPAEIETVSPRRYPRVPALGAKKIGFLCHVVNDAHVRGMDPYLRAIGRAGRDRFQEKFGPVTGPILFHEQLFEGANGGRVHLHCYGVFLDSKFFERSLRSGDGEAMRQVQALAERTRRDGMELLGLGQYTSIVSRNGLLLHRLGVRLTTGNGLTAGFAYQGLLEALRQAGRDPARSRIGVVGAAGNICSVVTQLLADEAGELCLVFREGTDPARARAAAAAVAAGSKMPAARIAIAEGLDSLRECDGVLLGTNSAGTVLLPEHLKPGAVVMDVSVPSNIDPRVYAERADVRCYYGGLAKLPLGQRIQSEWFPLPPGESYACLGETICAGLVDHPGNLSYGALTKETVLLTLDLARRVGMEMGPLRRVEARR
jgi:acetylornithine/succinyldiaminopimelate/putrescine aminotransferase/predicted amino acid dehydrogenase